VKTLEDQQYRPLFQEFLGMDVEEYLGTSRMRRARTYGSEVEIIAPKWYMYHPITQLQPLANQETPFENFIFGSNFCPGRVRRDCTAFKNYIF
jgi:hypothetical protein